MLKKLNLFLAASVASASAFAAYGPAAPAAPAASVANWTLGLGYGQMFGVKKTSNGTGTVTKTKVKNPTLLEVDLFHNNGFGLVYMTNASKRPLVIDATDTGEYSFNGYFAGYQRVMAHNFMGRVLLGLADQKYNDGTSDFKSSGEFAFAASGSYHMDLSGSLKGFAELGYLDMKKFGYNNTPDMVKAAGFYWKLGVKMPI